MLIRKLVSSVALLVPFAITLEIERRDVDVQHLLAALPRFGKSYSLAAVAVYKLKFSSADEFSNGQEVTFMNDMAESVSGYADGFREFSEATNITEIQGEKLSKAYKLFCESQCGYFTELVSLRSDLQGFEKVTEFFQLERNMEASLSNVNGAQVELYVSIEDVIKANKQESHTGSLLNLNNGEETFTEAINPAITAWRNRYEPATCSQGL
ncbi:hypothetical protein TWF730_006494 [Orbilia blumenaviensis]|uniref:Uncharacterized protein n=1 Tax=Orbilia blumenaviensis TaxID=1796055 RepID=A0AAV9VGS4_9PEZI